MLVALGIAAAMGLAIWVRPHEPVYEGRPLSYWMNQRFKPDFAHAYDAIRSIGAVGVPWMLLEVRSINSPFQKGYRSVWPFIPSPLRTGLHPPEDPRYAEDTVTSALCLLEMKAVPALVAAFRDKDSGVRRVAVSAIGLMPMGQQLADQTVPGICLLLNDPDEGVRWAALSTLEKMGANGKAAVPTLTASIQRDWPNTHLARALLDFRSYAVQILGGFGPDAKPAVPELRKLLSSGDHNLSSEAAIALWRIEGDTSVVPLLVRELERPGATYHPDVVTALEEMGAAAIAAVPALVRLLTNAPTDAAYFLSRAQERAALQKIDPTAAKSLGLDQVSDDQRPAEFLRRTVPKAINIPFPSGKR